MSQMQTNPVRSVLRVLLNVIEFIGRRYVIPMACSIAGAAAGAYFAFEYDLPLITAVLIGFGLGFLAWLAMVIAHLFH